MSGLASSRSVSTAGTTTQQPGWYALRDNSGEGNTADGTQTLRSNSGDYNSGFGFFSLYFNTGSNNTAVRLPDTLSKLRDLTTQPMWLLCGPLPVRRHYCPNDQGILIHVFLGATTKGIQGATQSGIVMRLTQPNLSGLISVVLGNDSIVTTALKGSVGIGTTTPGLL